MPAMNRGSTPESRHASADDSSLLERLGYVQELSRTLNAFSNFAISLSIICILAGGITSFHIGYCSVGGAAIGLGWPLVCLFSLAVARPLQQFEPRPSPELPPATLRRYQELHSRLQGHRTSM